jgi:hypothetical protein
MKRSERFEFLKVQKWAAHDFHQTSYSSIWDISCVEKETT